MPTLRHEMNRSMTTTSIVHRCVSTALLLLCLCSATAAQTIPERSLYFSLKAGATAYGGELDGTGTDDEGVRSNYGWMFGDLGLGLGLETGYRLNTQWSFGIGFHIGTYPNLDRADAWDPSTGTFGVLNEGTLVSQLHGVGRFSPVAFGRVHPYAQAGFALVFGQGRQNTTDSRILGFGPQIGLGAEVPVRDRIAVFLEVTGSRIYPDEAFDNSNPGLFEQLSADNADFDAIMHYSVGIRMYSTERSRINQ